MTEEVKHTEQTKLSEEALALKKQNDQQPHHPAPENHPNEGMNSTPRPDQPPSGAFDAEGQRPVLERSRKVR